MTKAIEAVMRRLERKYRKEGKSDAWIAGWKRGFYAADRQLTGRRHD